jgi:hypothetical protein
MIMRLRAGFAVTAAIAIAGITFAGCQNGVTGPSLSANFSNVSLQPTVAGLEGGQNVCCCHLVGRVTNTSTISVDAELRFTAKGADGRLLGTASDIVVDLPSGATRQFIAVGLTTPCKDISLSQVVADGAIRLKGLWLPPQ